VSARRRLLRLVTVLVALVPMLLAGGAANAAPTPYHLRGVSDARQLVVVTNRSWTSTYATLEAWEKHADGRWYRRYGPYTARIGRNGFGKPKREGDGQTPVGSFTVPSQWGVNANPGTNYHWLKVDHYDVWVDDSNSAYYNRHMRLPANGRWRSAESMYQSAYAYAATIGYNTAARTPGAGSAIFFHVSMGRATAGCVALPTSQLVPILRWIDWYKKPRFIMGPESAVTY
jgi:L,D-peptidoglycan transpeptidase YkuD (ErfK/YbiS/YcfS/YnhG family)